MKTAKQTVMSPEKIQTDETLAVNLVQDLKNGKAKLFSVAEMWNLRKNFRSASDMRRSWN
jgi:thiamine pyrophosphokinase